MHDRRTTPRVVTLLLCLFVLAGLAGCTASGISGVVIDAASKQPIEGAALHAGEAYTLSNAEGTFELALPLGTYQAAITREGYVSGAVEVNLGKKNRRQKLSIALEPRKATGHITEQNSSTPLGGARIVLGDTTVETDSQGIFTLPVLNTAPLNIGKAGYMTITISAEQLTALFDQDGRTLKSLDVELQPRKVSGFIRDNTTGEPVANAIIRIGDKSAVTDAYGAYELSHVEPGQPVVINSTAYRVPADTFYQGESTLDVALAPYQVIVTVSDSESGESLPEADLTAAEGSIQKRDDGTFLARVTPGTVITASLVGYKHAAAIYGGEESLQMQLSPAQLVGQLSDVDSGEPISGAVILAYTSQPEPVVLRSDDSGRFFYPEDTPVNEILVKAPGYERLTLPITRTGMLRIELTPFEARALYIPFGLLYDRSVLENIMNLAEGTEMNAIVVDLKDDLAHIAWQSQVPLAQELGAYQEHLITASEVIQMAHERGLYVIGRLVVFKDVLLARAYPEYAVRRHSGGYYVDLENLMWVDPFLPEVQQYNIDLAVELAGLGIDEVQYDYIRFPSDGSVEGLLYSQEATYESRTAVISQFISNTHAALMKTPAFFSVDVFGLVPLVPPGDDMGIGQTMEAVAPYVDYLCPMLYPTTFGPGELGYADPGLYPYDVVYRSMMAAHERTTTKVRPWLQHYSIFHYEYGPVERLQQRKAADDAGSCGWTYWNAAGWYERSSIEYDAYAQYPAVMASTPDTVR